MKQIVDYLLKGRIYLASIYLLAFSSVGHCTVYTNNVILGPGFLPGVDFLITQSQQPGNTGLFAVGINDAGNGTYNFSYQGIAEQYSVYSATTGLQFTPDFALNNSALLNNWNGSGSFQISLSINQSIFLAYWDDYPYWANSDPNSVMNVPDNTDAYGWFRLTRKSTGLELTGSATSIGAAGITVGTYNEISPAPEPTTLSLALLGFFTLQLLRRFSLK